jgi:two-component system KDP operon response regulator KdpE
MVGRSTGRRVLVVDDEASIVDAVATALRYEGFEAIEARTGRSGLALAQTDGLDLIVLDVMLPDIDGFEVARRLRADGVNTPILFLTARDALDDKVRGFGAGADDYVTKPFGPRELTARLEAVLRRSATAPDEPVLRAGNLELDIAAHTVRRDGEAVHLTPKEFELLRVLLRDRGRLVTHRSLLTEVWGPAWADDVGTLRTHMSNLRRKIEPAGSARLLHTDPGVGYRMS